MSLFSERLGFRKPKPMLGLQEVDDILKAGLWDACTIYFFKISYNNNKHVFNNAILIWHHIFKEPIDELPDAAYDIVKLVKDYFMSQYFPEVYDFIEFMAKKGKCHSGLDNEGFVNFCNDVLEREKSPYRFSGLELIPITNEPELKEVSMAQKVPISASARHMNSAVKAYGDRNAPNYRQTVAEAVHALEAVAREIINNQSATLSDAAKELKKQKTIHKALADAIVKFYGWASDTARHAEKGEISEPEARQALIVCSALVNYLTAKKV